jgi:hypothetical protein
MAVVVEVADDGTPDFLEPVVVCLEGQLPEEVVGQ